MELRKIKCPECGKEQIVGKWGNARAQITYCSSCGTIFTVIFRQNGSLEYVK
ncbi:MAG: hypothetical protein QXX41_08280 [Nitrososphaerota archaeon]